MGIEELRRKSEQLQREDQAFQAEKQTILEGIWEKINPVQDDLKRLGRLARDNGLELPPIKSQVGDRILAVSYPAGDFKVLLGEEHLTSLIGPRIPELKWICAHIFGLVDALKDTCSSYETTINEYLDRRLKELSEKRNELTPEVVIQRMRGKKGGE